MNIPTVENVNNYIKNKDIKPHWYETFFKLMEVISERSDDPNTKLGAVVWGIEKNQISFGYNGLPRNLEVSSEILHSSEKYHYMVHAEMNALTNAYFSTIGSTLFVPIIPCSRCAGYIINCGVSKVVFDAYRMLDYVKARKGKSGFLDSYIYTFDIFKNITIQAYYRETENSNGKTITLNKSNFEKIFINGEKIK